MAVTLNLIDVMRGLNGVNGDGNKLDDVFTNLTATKETEWYKNSKSFLNLNNMSDDELGTQEPMLSLGLQRIAQWHYLDPSKEQISDRNHSEFEPTNFAVSGGANIKNPPYASLTTETPVEIKPLGEIGNFDRICFIINLNQNIRFNGLTSAMGFPIYSTGQVGNIPIKCRKINQGTKSEITLNTYCGNVDFFSVSNYYIYGVNGANPTPYNNMGLQFWDFANVTNLMGNMSTNTWIFNNDTDANEYLDTGNHTKAINYHSDYIPPIINVEDDSNGIEYYWRQRVFTKTNSKSAKTYRDNLSFEFRCKVVNAYHRTLAIENNYSQTQIDDCELFVNNSDDIIEVLYKEYGDSNYTIKSIPFLQTLTLMWRDVRKMNGTQFNNLYLGAEVQTNIPVFSHGGDANKFFDDDIDDGSSKNADDINDYKDRNKNGDNDKESSELNEISTVNRLSELLELSTAFLSEMATFLSSDTQTMQELLTGLSLRGANPISFIVDLFALPFTIAEFRDVQSNNDMYFGNYKHTFSNSYNLIIRNNKLKTVFSTFIAPVYNDWRDYLTNVYIYLPFVNIQPLNYNEIVGKTLSCQVAVDIATGNIKYFLRVNGVVIQTIEGTVRQTLPISATDSYSSTMNKIGGASQILQGVVGAGVGGGSIYNSATKMCTVGRGKKAYNVNDPDIYGMIGGFGGVGGGIGSIASGMMQIIKEPPRNVSGNYSSATAFFDELNAYLIYEQTNVLYNENIINQYNLPDNRVNYLSSCNGYTVVDDIELNISASEDIRNDIKTLLSNGVYI